MPESPGSAATTSTQPSAREWLVRIFERGNRQHAIVSMSPTVVREPYTGPNWFRCADGTVLSVIAGWGTYCSPRPDWPEEWGGAAEDYSGPYVAVEVWFPEDDDPEGHVEPDRLWKYVNAHGGVVEYLPPGVTPDAAGWRDDETSPSRSRSPLGRDGEATETGSASDAGLDQV